MPSLGPLRRISAERKVSIGVLIGTLANLAVLPLAARIYGASEFGVAGVIVAVVSVVSPFVDLGASAEVAITSLGAVRRLLRRVALLFALFALVAIAMGSLPADIQPLPVEGPGEWLSFALYLGASVLFVIATGLCTRTGHVVNLGRGRAAQGIVGGSAVLLLGLASPTASSMVLGQSIGLVVGAAVTLSGHWNRGYTLLRLRAEPDPKALPLSRAVQSAGGESLRRLALQVPILIAGLGYSEAVVGQLVLAIRVASAPGSIVGVAATLVSQSDVARLVRAEAAGAERVVRDAIRRTVPPVLVYFVLTGSLAALLAPVTEAALGSSFEGVASLYLLLVPAYAVQAILAPMVPVLLLLRKQHLFVALLGVRVGAAIGACTAALALGASPLGYAAAYSAAMVIGYSSMAAVVLRHLRTRDATLRTPTT